MGLLPPGCLSLCCSSLDEEEVGGGAPAVEAVAADVKDHHIQQLRLGVEQECQHILLIQPHLIGGQVRPQMLQNHSHSQI